MARDIVAEIERNSDDYAARRIGLDELRLRQLKAWTMAETAGARIYRAVTRLWNARRGVDMGVCTACHGRGHCARCGKLYRPKAWERRITLRTGLAPHSQGWHEAMRSDEELVRRELLFVYVEDFGFALHEAYNCPCGSTFSIRGIGPLTR